MKPNLSILAIDDELLVLEGLRAVLQKLFPESAFYEAQDSETAKVRLREHPIDLILLDLDLRKSNESGVDFAPYIREHYPKIKIVILFRNCKNRYCGSAG